MFFNKYVNIHGYVSTYYIYYIVIKLKDKK